MIKAVLFDVDGVLIDSFDANIKFFQTLLAKAGYNPPTKEEYQPLFYQTMYEIITHLTKSSSEEELRRVWEMGMQAAYPYELLKMPEGMNETIQQLSKTYTLGIVTGRIKERIYTVPALAQIENLMDVTVGYQDTKQHKPHPEPLLFASQLLQIHPSEIVYIGDMQSDIIAGEKAGMKTIHYQNTSSFKNLLSLIQKLV